MHLQYFLHNIKNFKCPRLKKIKMNTKLEGKDSLGQPWHTNSTGYIQPALVMLVNNFLFYYTEQMPMHQVLNTTEKLPVLISVNYHGCLNMVISTT